MLFRAQECAGKENGSQGRASAAGGGSSSFPGGTGDTTIKEDEPEDTTLEILLLAGLGLPGVQADVHSMEDMDSGGRGLHRMEKDMVARTPIAGRGLHHMEKDMVARSPIAGRSLHRMEKGKVAGRKQRRYTIGCSW